MLHSSMTSASTSTYVVSWTIVVISRTLIYATMTLSMIHVIAKQCCNANFQEFWDWQLEQKRFMVDTETTVTDSYVDRRLILVQFGSGEDEWLLQWSYLSEIQKKLVGEILFDERTKVLHNAYF